MKTILSLFLALCLSTLAWGQNKKLTILHTNDLHSRLNGYTPELQYTPLVQDQDKTVGGFSRLHTAIQQERESSNPEEFLLLDAGDFLMGSLFQSLERNSGFQLGLMQDMGYHLITFGNHEFDWGPDALAEVILAAKEKGPIPPIVFTNIKFDPNSTADDKLASLYSDGTIQPYHILDRGGIRIGFIGILGYDAIRVSPSASPVTFTDPIKTAKAWARMLRTDYNVDMVICLSHSGVMRDKKGEWGGEDKKLALKVPEIDVIIGGHTHMVLESPLSFDGTPVVQTGAYGEYLGKLEIEIDGDFNLTKIDGRLIRMDDKVAGDHYTQNKIDIQEAAIDRDVLAELSLHCRQVLANAAFPVEFVPGDAMPGSNLGRLLADANYYYVNHLPRQKADLAFFASGMIRDNMGEGQVAVADAFRIVSLGDGNDNIPGYPLATVYVTGKELKGIMEVLYLAPTISPDNYVYIGGARVTYNPKKGLLRKIQKIELGDDDKGYREINLSKSNTQLYSIVADVYLLEFFGLIKQMSKGLIKVTLKDATGNPLKSIADARIDLRTDMDGVQEAKEWLALVWYLSRLQDVDGDEMPDIPEQYRKVTPSMIPVAP